MQATPESDRWRRLLSVAAGCHAVRLAAQWHVSASQDHGSIPQTLAFGEVPQMRPARNGAIVAAGRACWRAAFYGDMTYKLSLTGVGRHFLFSKLPRLPRRFGNSRQWQS